MTLFVAFGHRKLVGKDTAGRLLCSDLRLALRGSNVQVASFASKLKDVCYQLYSWAGLMPESYYEDERNIHLKEVVLTKLGKSPRQVWIEMGTLVGRAIYMDTWTEYLFQNTKADVCIIRDLRFPNEADQILALGGLVYRIDRKQAPNNSDIADDPLATYEKWSGVINNHDSLLEFNKSIVSISKQIQERLK